MNCKNILVFKDIPLFRGLCEDDILKIMPCLGVIIKKYEKNQTVFYEGESATKFGIVLSGSVRLEKEDYSGNRNIIGIIKKSNLFAEAYACCENIKYPISYITGEPSEIMIIESAKIHSSCINSCEIHKILIRNLLKIVSSKNIMLNRKIEIMSKRTTKEKIMAYLYSEAENADSNIFTIPFDRQALADYLGVERSAMSAEIGKLRDAGIIDVDKSCFKILKSKPSL